MIQRETKEWITFEDFKEYLKNPFEEGWITIFKIFDDKEKNQNSATIFSTFIKKDFKEKSSEKTEWDFLMMWLGYNREEIEPILFYRSFYGVIDSFLEVSQKFRHYFNLYEKEDKNLYFLEDSGDEIKVIDFKKSEIKLNVKFLFEYLRDNNLILSFGFDIIRFHDKEIEGYDFEIKNDKVLDEELNYSFYARNESFLVNNAKSFSSINGKKYMECPIDFDESFLEPKRQYEEFIIGVDNLGNNLYFTCEEDKLGNYFGKNPKAPQFTKPVFFKKEVLDKYYTDSEKYSVSDGYLSCDGLWGISIDNNLEENVAAHLGDLGRLPHKEQKHWKQHNISKGKISEPFFQRNFMGEFCSPSGPVEYFKERFILFNRNWNKKFGWDLFKSLNKEDEHHWKTLRLPKDNNQKEFDENLLSLIKILIGSLNEKEMKKEVGHQENEKSISLLERYLEGKHNIKSSQMILFLKDIQELRSKGVAHRKSSDFSKFYENYNKGDFSKTFKEIIFGVIKTLNTIENKI